MLTDDMKRDLLAELAHSRTSQSACIEAMQIVQRHLGWVSDETICDIAEFLDMTPEELDGVATFYNHIYRKPVGRHVILICDSVCCWIMGYRGLREHITSRLGIDLGETTKDGLFTMLPIQCLGACDKAPALMIDGKLYTDLTAEKFDMLIESYRK
ncbi:MAG TPA: NADH-quinone oxidoreductase subunit NuoE [Desulfomonilaceae bacterium]|nr:NADH-quinone oxidoreductase subunit NuoE [Desulfomonilaceae bacterium]